MILSNSLILQISLKNILQLKNYNWMKIIYSIIMSTLKGNIKQEVTLKWNLQIMFKEY